jgi:hypothetical protein
MGSFLHNRRAAGFLILIGPPESLHSPEFYRITGVSVNRQNWYASKPPGSGRCGENKPTPSPRDDESPARDNVRLRRKILRPGTQELLNPKMMCAVFVEDSGP